jgi:photosystem II stability/assembly factor-like uncharacterized protein
VAVLLAAAMGPALSQGVDTDQPAWRAEHGVLLSVTRAGDRLVAVGDRGTILLSDDDAATWKVQPSPTQALLTSTLFTSPREGWAVGQDATILHTADAGLHWATQKSVAGNDQALFSVAQLGPNHLIATGAYALVLETQDGGRAWTQEKLPNLDEDYHLNCVMAHGQDVVVTGEAGHAFVRHGGTWTPMPVGYDGSQFGCLASQDGTMYSFGLRGSLFVSSGAAPAWKRIETGEQRSIFGSALLSDGTLALVGGNGLVMQYDPKSGKLHTLPPPTGATLSGVVQAAHGKWVAVGDDGVHVIDPAASGHSAEATQ